jgi:hypothetical protein
VAPRARRKNARRTWPDGSGCDQRPLDPCSPGCPGWGWFNDEEIQRCDDCAIFDDDDDAREHVAGCVACRAELRRQQRGDDVYRYTTPAGGELPPYSQRKSWAAWANRNGDSRCPKIQPTSDARDLFAWLTRMDPNGDYRGLELAELWVQLGVYADNYPDE